MESDLLEIGRGHRVETGVAFSEAAKPLVMIHHGLAVGAELEIALNAVTTGDGRGERGRRVFDPSGARIMQPPVRDRARREPVEVRHGAAYDTSNKP